MIAEDAGRSDQYFASLGPNELAPEALKRVEDFDKYVYATGRRDLWARAYNYYNRAIYKDARINNTGEQGEYSDVSVNHYRNILTHIKNTITKERPTFEAKAINSDYKSQAQTIVANNICEYYMRVKNTEKVISTVLEDFLVFNDGYVYQGFDFDIGDPFMVDPNNPQKTLKQGDLFHKNFPPFDVIFDFTASIRNASRDWHILRDYQNKWDLIEKYPDKKNEILQAATDFGTRLSQRVGYAWNYSTDYVPVFIFMHERTSAVSGGRFYTFITDKCWFIDSNLPSFYKKVPLYRLKGPEQRLSGFGYSIGLDLLPLQEAVDGLYSVILTNQSTFGVQNILVPNGSNISNTQIEGGLNIINYDPKHPEPKALALVSTPKEIFEFLAKLEQTMEILSGVNSVSRGNPESSLKSGTALALVLSTAIEFVTELQQAYIHLIEELGTAMIDILKENSQTPRMIEIVGKTNQSYLKEFSQSDIKDISRVTVEVGNPLSRTTAGKVSIAENMLNAGMVKTPEEYIQVLTTGRLEPLIDGDQAELMLIRSENESMSGGNLPPVTAVDNHSLHVREHKSVLASVDARADQKITETVLAHITEHINLWRQTDPALLQLLNEAPPAMMAIPGAPGNAGQLAPTNSTQEEAANVKPPQQIKNPLTKEPIGG